jgi:heterodisulfide reductase subunit A-like polyferredoxin
MPRIGIIIDALRGSIPASFREKISNYVKELPEIAVCLEEENLTSSDALNKIGNRLKTERIDGIVIIGGSPKLYESSFQKSILPLTLNPYLFAVANIREQVLWTMLDEEIALEKAKTIISKTLRIVSHSKPVDVQSLPLKPKVLVLGGGIIGISIAHELTQTGIHVSLVEKEAHLGGRALELHKFYNHPLEVQKWMGEKISELKKNTQITIFTQSKLKCLEGHVGRFQATIEGPNRTERTFSVSAIIVATGYTVHRERRGIYGHKRVVGFADMEKLLYETTGPSLLWDGKQIETVTYLLDEINEDIKVDSINAIKQSLVLQYHFKRQVAILCKDVKVAVDGMERLYRKARETGVLFFKYEEPPKLSIVNGQIQVDIKDTSAIQKKEQWPVSILSDLVVVSDAFIPTPEAESLSSLLKIHLGNRGFLMEDNPQLLRVRSNRRGIFIAGACRFPQEVSESMIEARAVAQEVTTLLLRGTYTFDLAVAEVDPKKCAVCYTCPRLCPHSAITVEKYGERNVYITSGIAGEMKWGAAKVDPASCYGCGICVAECPSKAITLQHLTDAQIYAQMNL